MCDSLPLRFTTCFCAVFMIAVAAASPAAAEQRGGGLEAAWQGLCSTDVGEAHLAAEALPQCRLQPHARLSAGGGAEGPGGNGGAGA